MLILFMLLSSTRIRVLRILLKSRGAKAPAVDFSHPALHVRKRYVNFRDVAKIQTRRVVG